MRNSTGVKLTVAFAVGALALTACGSGSSSSGGKKTFTIGYQGPLSGDNKQLGINMDNAVQLAIQQANAKGDLPFTLKFTDSDDGGSGALAPTAARKLIDDSSVVAVVGPAFSGATAAAEPLFSQANLVSVTPSATRADLTSDGFTSFLRVITGDNVQGAKDADWMVKVLKLKSVYLVDDKSPYGAGLIKFVKDGLTSAGVSVTSEGIAPTKDYSALATKVVGKKVDAVYYAGYYAEFALFTKALHAAGFTGKLISDDGSKDPQYIAQGGAATEGAYLSCPCGPTSTSAAATQFASDYKAKFGVDPGTYSAESFDAANAIISAMKTLGSGLTRASLLAAMKTVNYPGITHTITFDAKGEGGTGEIFIYQVKNGQIALLGKTEDLIK